MVHLCGPTRLGLVCSSRYPSAIVLSGLDIAAGLRTAPATITSGFHSPLERECLGLLLKGPGNLIICPARSAVGMRIPAAWKAAMAEGRLTIRSPFDEGWSPEGAGWHPPAAAGRGGGQARLPRRPTAKLADIRNRFVCAISDAVLILHSSPGGKLERLALDLLADSAEGGAARAGAKPVWTLDDPTNTNLLTHGARPLRPDNVAALWEEGLQQAR